LEVLNHIAAWWAGRSAFGKGIWIFAFSVLFIELAFRRMAPKSLAYRRWTSFFESIGHVWTVVILGLVYFLSVSLVAVFMKMFAKDPLDRGLDAEPSFWRPHEPNPLGPEAASRHQF
jgi:hypothetical protein